MGHSSGEIAAAYCVGGLSRESALKVAYYRGAAADSVKETGYGPMSMMSVGLSIEDVKPYLDQRSEDLADLRVFVGCINSPRNVTLSGTQTGIGRLQALFNEQGIFSKILKVDIAYHTSFMERSSITYGSLISNIQSGKLDRPPVMFSSVTGQQIDAASLAQPDYWVRNMVSTVRFSDAVSWICAKPSKRIVHRGTSQDASMVIDHSLELGPHSTLRGPLKDIFDKFERGKTMGYGSLLRRHESAMLTALEAAGRLHCMGYTVDLGNINIRSNDCDIPRMLVDLPNYPFNHAKKYWLESRKSRLYRFRPFPHHELLGTWDLDWNPLLAKWHNRLSTLHQPFLKDHAVSLWSKV